MKKRDSPLYTMEEILRINNIEYDTSTLSDHIIVIVDNKEIVLDTTYNMFDDYYLHDKKEMI